MHHPHFHSTLHGHNRKRQTKSCTHIYTFLVGINSLLSNHPTTPPVLYFWAGSSFLPPSTLQTKEIAYKE